MYTLNMMLILHVCTALASLGYAAHVLVAPTKFRLQVSCGLAGLTIGSGAYLVWSVGAPLLETCLTGLLYLSVIFALTLAAYHKLLRLETSRD